jgi:23S rRNA (guanosine2251-2'-O)-methyltransferase
MVVKRGKVVNVTAGDRRADRARWLYGINAVARRLEVQPSSIRALHLLRGDSSRRAQLAQAAERARIALHEADQATLRRLTGSDAHQGVAALADPYQYGDLRAVLENSSAPVLVLDQVQDPHNLGALIRTAAAVGMAAVVIPRHGAAAITPAVEKVAAGAVNDVPICQAANVRRCLLDLRELGYWSIALSPDAGQNLFALDLPERAVLVLGGETGLRPLVEQTCDLRAAIPLRDGVESLNASVAGAVAMYEVARRLGRLDRSGGRW